MGESFYDDIVIGGGSAGSVLASRLSEDPARRVLLVEAGPHYGGATATPPDILDGNVISVQHSWGYSARITADRSIPFLQGRVTGGSSAINLTAAVRGTRQDFTEWAELGNPLWSWEDVLPRYVALEDDLDFGHRRFHGRGGPVPVRRWRDEELTPVQEAFYSACLASGLPDVPDHNHPDSTGVGPNPLHRQDTRVRVSTAMGYLWPARGRANLEILSGTVVDRVLFRDGKAYGVRLSIGSGWQQMRARRVVLAAGVVGSPSILLRSGVGPAEHLRELGIGVEADLPGVGAGLTDQPRIGVFLTPRPGAENQGSPPGQVVVRTTSQAEGTPGRFNDLYYIMVNRIDLKNHFAGLRGTTSAESVFGVMALIRRVHSRGRITLASADPRVAPTIDLGYFSDERDYAVMAEAVRGCWEFTQSPKIRDYGQDVLGLDEDTIDSPEALRRYVTDYADSAYNAVGTARMGPDGDPGAVVDQRCKVRGVDNLYVADASVMPAMVCANTHLTVVMIGEHAAAMLREG
ncbi:GMC family oxidoreductase [Actinacidiphila acididurans]|uniref:GMC family oxidoreductase n=1 Tax=Actinacidiphila acididurans TaxID=2784346 RepID=UPI0027DD4339|nr:GMC family oxidoreductase N-terminal domain-containing protein [Actinacidiphila acididurans]